MSNQTLCCDYCESTHREVPIIENPKRFALNTKVYDLTQVNSDGREVDNICLECLKEQIENYVI